MEHTRLSLLWNKDALEALSEDDLRDLREDGMKMVKAEDRRLKLLMGMMRGILATNKEFAETIKGTQGNGWGSAWAGVD